MRRREFIRLFSSTVVAWPLTARAQQAAMPVIGYLNGASAAQFPQLLAGFHKGLSETGYSEGRVPAAAVIAVLANPKNPISESQLTELRAAARKLDRQLLVLNASTESDFAAVSTDIDQHNVDALFVAADPFFDDRRKQIVSLAASHRIPACYTRRDFVVDGGLLSYGPDAPDAFRQAGVYTGRILKGEKPADLPVMEPIKFEMVINLKTAKALGLNVPATLLARADEVIE